MTNPQILADNYKKILIILNNIIKNEDNNSLIDYPVLIGSRAAKWHIISFREPNDWDLMATPLQTTLFINKVKESNATFKYIKLIYYPGGGLKLAGKYIDQYTADKKLISFDIELVSEKVDLRNMKSIFEYNSEDNEKVDDMQDDNEFNFDIFEDNYKKSNAEDSEDNMKDDDMQDDDMQDDDEINEIEFERFNDVHPKMSALMILELCRNIEDKIMLPLLSNFLCIIAPLKILEALKTSQIYWPADFHKNISDLHLLRILLDYNKDKVSIIQPLYSPQRDELIELILETRIKETEIIQGKSDAYINLNMSNNDFLEYEDNLFVQQCISHEDLYELVKYGDHPIYQGLRDGQSKALIKKSLFEKLDYQTKINCIKEVAMVIALERYLIPMISKDQENSYKLALVRIYEDSDEDKDEDDSDSFDIDNVDISFEDPLEIHPYQSRSGKFSKLVSKHTFVLGIGASASWNRWSVDEDIWEPINIKVKSADYVASLLEIPDITGDLLFKYVLDCLKPTLICDGDTPLKHWVNKLKSNGTIPIEPNQHPCSSLLFFEMVKKVLE
ncbi:21175_t:CDS:2 [Rhizophagus irregularis]|nr:21175_t:CDS:2 [Rhizophagus irregularis]